MIFSQSNYPGAQSDMGEEYLWNVSQVSLKNPGTPRCSLPLSLPHTMSSFGESLPENTDLQAGAKAIKGWSLL